MFSSLKKLFGGSEANPEVNNAALAQATQVESTPFTVEPSAILVQQTVESRQGVLALISKTMLEHGYVSADYTNALEAREQAVSTYLTNGFAIPHGVNEAKKLVLKTGIVVVQLPQGVVWNDNGDKVHVAVGIAATGNEHIEVLQRLTNVVMDDVLADHLGSNGTVAEIARALGHKAPQVNVVSQVAQPAADASAQCIIVDEAGLHARPASTLIKLAKTFANTQIWLTKEQHRVELKSMVQLLNLGAKLGDVVTVSASGEQAQAAVESISAAIAAGLDEPAAPAVESNTQEAEAQLTLSSLEGRMTLTGIAASPGVAFAPAFVMINDSHSAISQTGGSVEAERTLLNDALLQAHTQLRVLHDAVAISSPVEAAIFAAHVELLTDSDILAAVDQQIAAGNSAAWAWHHTLHEQAKQLEGNASEMIKARAADLRDVCDRVLHLIMGTSGEIQWPDQPFVLVAKELSPSQTAQLNQKPVRAICTELGGATSHMAILARALGIPALVGMGTALLDNVTDGEALVVAPQNQSVVLSPATITVEQAEQAISVWQAAQAEAFASKDLPAVTLDGVDIEVVCNIASAQDAEQVVPNGGMGVGLLRTEFLFETASEEPTVEAQAEQLRQIVKPLGKRTLIVRTSDIGGDKPVSWLRQPKEENPFLGVRGIRLSLRHQDVFKRQLQAIYQVAKEQDTGIHIMFPMISSLSEWHAAKALAEEVRSSIDAPELPLGMMIEVPSAALLASHFAKEVDFFSIGTNDLTQYTLAMDRMNPELSDPLDNYHPALLQMIAMTTRAAQAAGKWVGVCGNLVAEPDLAKLLIGLGVTELSVSPVNVPAVKALVRGASHKQLQQVANRVLEAATPEDVKRIVRS